MLSSATPQLKPISVQVLVLMREDKPFSRFSTPLAAVLLLLVYIHDPSDSLHWKCTITTPDQVTGQFFLKQGLSVKIIDLLLSGINQLCFSKTLTPPTDRLFVRSQGGHFFSSGKDVDVYLNTGPHQYTLIIQPDLMIA